MSLNSISPEELIDSYRLDHDQIRISLSQAEEAVSLPPEFSCSLVNGKAFVNFGTALEKLSGTYMTPESFLKWLDPELSPQALEEQKTQLIGDHLSSQPLLTAVKESNETKIILHFFAGSSNLPARTLSELGSNTIENDEQLWHYQQAYHDVYQCLLTQGIDKTKEHLFPEDKKVKFLWILEDCAASGDTLLGFLSLLTQLGIMVGGLRIDLLTATPHALILMIEEMKEAGIEGEIRVGYLGWALSKGDDQGHGKNYIERAPFLDLPGPWVVGDIGDRSVKIKDEELAVQAPWQPWRADDNPTTPLAQSQTSDLVVIFPNGGWLPLAFLKESQNHFGRSGLPWIAIEAKRAYGKSNFGVMFGEFEELKKSSFNTSY